MFDLSYFDVAFMYLLLFWPVTLLFIAMLLFLIFRYDNLILRIPAVMLSVLLLVPVLLRIYYYFQ